jgi:plastocyanin
MKLRVAILGLALLVPLGGVLPSRAATVNLTISNFRYCSGSSCLPIDFVYVRNPTGNGLLNKNALAVTLIFRKVVHPGDTVVWTYNDSICDAIAGCPGHAVCFENGTAGGDCGQPAVPSRFAAARSGPTTISYTVPASTKPGTLLRYFCNVNEHYLFGMTGALLVK